MKLTALVVACLASVAIAGPVPDNRYIIRRPQNSVNLHSTARQLTTNTGQTFRVKLDDDDFDSVENLRSLQGVGRFATAQVGVASAGARTAQNLNVGGTGQFRVEIDDDGEIDIDSRESNELFFSSAPCPAGQLRHGNRCVIPKINRNIFVFGREDGEPEPKSIDPASIPLPQLDYNIIFVRSRPAKVRNPHIVPPPQKKTVVYVLEDESAEDDNVIEAPAFPDADPEVYYVKVRDGENPQLPGGLDLETAYSQAIRPLQLDDSFESSLELTLGGPGAAVGGGGGSFNSALEGVGVPLSATQPQATFGGQGAQASFRANGAQDSFGGSGAQASFGANGAQDSFGANGAQDSFGANGAQDSFGGAAGFGGTQSVGVPLPSFQGSADFNTARSLGRSSSSARDQAFAGTQHSAGARNFEIEIDDGRVEIEQKSGEAVRPALRYHVPLHG